MYWLPKSKGPWQPKVENLIGNQSFPSPQRSIHSAQNWSLENTKKVDWPLVRLKEKKKEGTVSNFWNDKGLIATSPADSKKIQMSLTVH